MSDAASAADLVTESHVTERVGTAPVGTTPGGARRERRRTSPAQAPRLRSLLDPSVVYAAVAMWLVGCWLALIAATPYAGDDLINKDVRTLSARAGRTLVELIHHQVSLWMDRQGRFFPGSLAWTYSLFWFVQNRVGYKLVLGCVLAAAVIACALVAVRLGGRWRVGAVFVPLMFGTVQIRSWADGITSFASLVALSTALSIGALAIILWRTGAAWAVVAAVLYACALVTYEPTLFFAPVLAGVVLAVRRRWWPLCAVIVPAAVQTVIVLHLRTELTRPTAAGYTVSLEGAAVMRTFLAQTVAALPMSQWIFADESVPPITVDSIVVAGLLAGVPILLLLAGVRSRPISASWGSIACVAVLGLWIWLAPSLLVAVTQRWQEEVTLGRGYLSVVYGYFGVALCVLALWLVGERWMSTRSTLAVRTWTIATGVVIAAVATLTFAGNIVLVSTLSATS